MSDLLLLAYEKELKPVEGEQTSITGGDEEPVEGEQTSITGGDEEPDGYYDDFSKFLRKFMAAHKTGGGKDTSATDWNMVSVTVNGGVDTDIYYYSDDDEEEPPIPATKSMGNITQFITATRDDGDDGDDGVEYYNRDDDYEMVLGGEMDEDTPEPRRLHQYHGHYAVSFDNDAAATTKSILDYTTLQS